MSFLSAGWRVGPRLRPRALGGAFGGLFFSSGAAGCVLISNLSFKTCEEALREHLEGNGVPVQRVKIFKTREKRHRGTGLVMFPSEEACEAATELLTDKEFMGRKLHLRKDPKQKGRGARVILRPIPPEIEWRDLRDELLLTGVVGMQRVEVDERRQRAVAYFKNEEDCAYSTDLITRFGVFGQRVTTQVQGRQVLVKHLPRETSKEDLIQAFECYGELVSVEILTVLKTAFIRFRDSEAANKAYRDRRSIKLHGGKLVVKLDHYG